MQILQQKFTEAQGWSTIRHDQGFSTLSCQLVLVFGGTSILSNPVIAFQIKEQYPVAQVLLASTAGEILDVQVYENTIALTAICFEKSRITTAFTHIDEVLNSYEAGKYLATRIDPKGLKNILVISDGQKVNGSELVAGLQNDLPKDTIMTGGLAGDGADFKRTLVGLNETPLEGRIVAIAFYGDRLTVSFGSMGGWDPFGPERLITKSKSNVLYELDNNPALDIYKKYLGTHASELPSSGLLFPLSIRNGENISLVRTILAVNEEEKSLTFAGNMPEGYYARLMKANFDRIIEGSSIAAQHSVQEKPQHPDLAILISCVGRKLVLNHRIEEEVEVIRSVYGNHTALVGFYSYGEISPTHHFSKCELHNQTMTITTLTEM